MSFTNEVESISSNTLDLIEQYNQNKDRIYKYFQRCKRNRHIAYKKSKIRKRDIQEM